MVAAALVVLVALAFCTVAVPAQVKLTRPGQSSGNITVTSPAAAAAWDPGKRYTIEWTSEGVRGNVKIVLVDGAGKETVVAASALNNGTYSYTVPRTLSDGQYKVRVVSSDGKVAGESASTISIGEASSQPAAAQQLKPLTPAGTPTVTKPKPAGTLTPAGGVQGQVTPGSTTPSVAEADVSSELVELGNMPTAQAAAAQAQLLDQAVMSIGAISSPGSNVAPTSFAPYIWVDNPEAGTEWEPGTTQTVEWASNKINGNVSVTLVKDQYQYPIATNIANSGSCTYTVPASVGLGRNRYTVRVSEYQGSVKGESQPFTVYQEQPIDVCCQIANFRTRKRTTDGWMFYGSVERWMEFDIAVKNQGTYGPVVVPLFWRLIKLPEEVVVMQEGGAFGDVYPGAWYQTANPLKYDVYSYERKYIVSDIDVNFEAGNYRLELYADYGHTLNEREDLRDDNIATAMITIQTGGTQ